MNKLHPYHEITATGQNWELFRSKKALRDALADAPGFIVWRAISGPQDGFRDRYLTTAELVEAINESAVLVGPHPETNRKYFGTVTVKAGKIQVK